jgi:hypothetical protein
VREGRKGWGCDEVRAGNFDSSLMDKFITAWEKRGVGGEYFRGISDKFPSFHFEILSLCNADQLDRVCKIAL